MTEILDKLEYGPWPITLAEHVIDDELRQLFVICGEVSLDLDQARELRDWLIKLKLPRCGEK